MIEWSDHLMQRRLSVKRGIAPGKGERGNEEENVERLESRRGMDAVEGRSIPPGDIRGYFKRIEAIIVEESVARERFDILPRHRYMKGQYHQRGACEKRRAMPN